MIANAEPSNPISHHFPAHWQMSTLGECAEKPDYGFTASSSSEPVGPKFLRITDIQNGMVDWNQVPYCDCLPVNEQKVLRNGDIVIARIGATTGKAFIIDECPDAVFASYLIRVRADRAKMDANFLYEYLQTDSYWQHIDKHKDDRLKGGVNIPALVSLPIPIPPLSEQIAIGQSLAVVRRAMAVERNAEQVAKRLKLATMREIFSRGVRNGASIEVAEGPAPESWKLHPFNKVVALQRGFDLPIGKRTPGPVPVKGAVLWRAILALEHNTFCFRFLRK